MKDVSRGIILPGRMVSELAELMGIIFGDGHIYCNDKTRDILFGLVGVYLRI